MFKNKYWLLKTFSMAEEGDEGGGGAPNADGLLPEGNAAPNDGSPGDPPADPPAGDDNQEWFLKDKYKTVEDQAKAYPELAKKLGESSAVLGAPEGNYELTMPEGVEGEFMEGNASMDNVLAFLKEKNISQDIATGLFHAFVSGESEMMSTSRDTEIKALGDNVDNRLQNLSDFGMANLDKDNYENFKAVASTAAGVQVLEAMMGLTRNNPIPDNNVASPSQSGVTAATLKEMAAKKDDNGNKLMSIDPAYKKKVDQAYNDFYGSQPKTSVIG